MATTNKDSSIAGTDNRPPMLVESDYESWKIRIERYIRGKPLGKLIWRSIQNGPNSHPQITVTEGQGVAAVQVTRDKTDEEFTEIENNRELADIQATNILSQGLLRHVFNILNQMRTGKDIQDNVELLMKGSRKSLQQKRKNYLMSTNDFLDIPVHQMNTKFVNNLPPYWAKYVTNVKNNKDISATIYVELYTYLKSYEPHALKTLKKQELSSSIVDPLAYLSSTTHHLTPTQPTNPLPSTSSLTLPPQPAAQSRNDAMLATMNQIRKAPGNVGNTGARGTQSYGQVTNNKGKLVIYYNFHGEGHVSRQCKEKKKVKYSQYFKDKMLLMVAKEEGAVLDVKAKAYLADVECTAPYDQPLAITTTNIFEVSHEDAYDSDVDEGLHAATAFMVNLSSTSGTNGATTSHVNEVHIDDNQIFNTVNHLLAHEMHQEEHLDFDVESDIDDNTISYHQYQLDSEVQDAPTEVSSVSPGEISMITILDDLRNQLDGHLKVNQEQSMVNDSLRGELARPLGSSNLWYANQAKIAQPTLYDGHALLKPTNTPVRVHDSKESLVQAEISRTKISNRPRTIKPINYVELNALYSHFVPHKELSQKQVYWLPAEELATQKSNPPKPVTLFFHTHPAPKYEQCVLEKKKLQIEKKNLLIQNECLITDCITKDIWSIVLTSDRDRPLSEELSSNCVRENSKVIELEAEILKQQQMLAESNKRCSFDKQALETELTQLKDAITSVRIQNDGFKITALTVENAKLKSKTLSKMHSKPIVPEKPKVLAPGMYAISSKYIIPPQRVNRAEPTRLPKKKKATFQEPPRPSNRPIQKIVVQQNKKPIIYVNLST
nr:hypothetical protein [Tanacetum cinerariifolium]